MYYLLDNIFYVLMIIKILKSSTSFNGINYSEKKNDKGVSELLKAKNFDGLMLDEKEATKADYIRYMKMISNLNENVKNKQFHAIVSTKGNNHSFEELTKIAEEYLMEMGYRKNPYLIYGHSDTENKHVHIVTTRVDKEGRKVPDSFENIRSQKVMQDIMNQDIKNVVFTDIQEALRYKFATQSQLRILLEQKGYKIKEDDDELKIIKYGIVQGSIKKGEVDEKIKQNSLDTDKIKQLKAIFSKYKKYHDTNDFIKEMREKFGIQIIFHRANGHEKPYGYTIIDNANKNVFKGSQVLKLKDLLNNVKLEDRIGAGKSFIENIDVYNTTLSQLKKSLYEKYQVKINNEGNLFVGESKLYFDSGMRKEVLEQLKYNDRVFTANKYKHNTKNEAEALTKLFNIKNGDLKSNPHNRKNTFDNILHNAKQTSDPLETLRGIGINILNIEGNEYMFDEKEKIFMNIDKSENLRDYGQGKFYDSHTKVEYKYNDDTLSSILMSMANNDNERKRKNRNRNQSI